MFQKMLAVSLLFMAIIGYTIYREYPTRPPTVDKERLFMHCYKCMKETKYDEEKFNKPCRFCGEPETQVGTKESILKAITNEDNPWSRMIVAVIIEVNLWLGSLLGVYFLSGQGEKKAEDFYYFGCPKCGQRLRYRHEKMGETGQCPRCKKTLIFPEIDPEEEIEDLPWYSLKKWKNLVSAKISKIRNQWASKKAGETKEEENEE